MLPKGGAKRIIPLEGRTSASEGIPCRLACSADKVGRLPDNRCLTIKTTWKVSSLVTVKEGAVIPTGTGYQAPATSRWVKMMISGKLAIR